MATTGQLLGSVGLTTNFLEIDNASHYTSIFVMDPIESQRIRTFAESVAKAHNEEVVALLDVQELQRDAKWTIILTDTALYKFAAGQPLNQPRKRKPLTAYFGVSSDLSDPRQFTTLLYKDSLKTSMKASWQRLVGRTGAKIDISSVLQKREYICKSELQRDQFVWAMRRVLQQAWQTTIEAQVVPEPEIYQQHHLVIKRNARGANQERLLILSTMFLYNIEMSHDLPATLDQKWCFPIECVTAVSLEEGCRLDFFFDKDDLNQYLDTVRQAGGRLRKGLIEHSKLQDTYQFFFADERTRAGFVSVLRHLYLQRTNGTRELKMIVSTESLYTNLDVDIAPGRVRKGSILESVLHEQQVINEMQPVLSDTLEKITHDSVDKTHPKVFAFYPDLTIKWGDSATKFKYSAKVISVIKAQSLVEKLPPERRPNFFALRTTEKPLYLLASDATSAATWRAAVEAYTGASQLSTNIEPDLLENSRASVGSAASVSFNDLPAQAPPPGKPIHRNDIARMELTVPVINGYLSKFVKNGKSEHVKYFALHADGTIHWGESPGRLKYRAIIIDVDQDISSLELSHQQAMRFVRLKTTDKTLELLCPNQRSADRWCTVANKVLNPDYEDDQEENDDVNNDGNDMN